LRLVEPDRVSMGIAALGKLLHDFVDHCLLGLLVSRLEHSFRQVANVRMSPIYRTKGYSIKTV
jgi:hypothetical protein